MMTTWQDILTQRRWMPLGRASDPKAPASGFKNDDPGGWLVRAEVTSPLAGLNFGAQAGRPTPPLDIVVLDCDFKPELMPSPEAEQSARQRLRTAERGFDGCARALSHSGKGLHIFGAPDAALVEYLLLRHTARLPVVLTRSLPDANGRRKPAAAIEIFGGGNAYVAVTDRWRGGAPGELGVITLGELRALLPELDNWQRDGRPPPTASLPARGDEAADALRSTPVPADYDEWFRLVISAKRAGCTSDDVEAWSSTGSNYRVGEVLRRWDGLSDRSDGITAKSLYQAARAAGWQPERERAGNRQAYAPSPLRDGISELERRGQANRVQSGSGGLPGMPSEISDALPQTDSERVPSGLGTGWTSEGAARLAVEHLKAPPAYRCGCATCGDAVPSTALASLPDTPYGLAICDSCGRNFAVGGATLAAMDADIYAPLLCRRCSEVFDVR